MASFSGGGNASSNSNSKGPLMDETKLVKYKTVMCQRMVRVNNCRYGHLCDFAHDANELRRNLNQHWYQGVMCEIVDHDDKKCEFSHNEMELMYHPSVYKTKLCDKYLSAGGCPKNQYCAYAHGKADLRTPKPAGQAGKSGAATSPAQSPPSNPKNGGNFESKRSGSRQPPGPELSPQGHMGVPHRQQSFPTFAENTGPRVPMHVSPADLQQEFQDTTNDLKIRILDLVDQISSMHADRANYESHQKANQIVQDAYKGHREQTSALQRQIENARLLIQALQGNPGALARLSPAALQQLSRKTSQAATAIAAYKPPASNPTHSLIQDLSELEI